MARCRGCSAEIDFVRLRSGKLMPVESAEPEEYRVWDTEAAARGTGDPRRLAYPVVLIVHGEVLRLWGAKTVDAQGCMETLDGPLRVAGVESHFATCPDAGEFRR